MSYPSQRVSNFSIQNGRTVTECCGPSSALCPNSSGGLPMVNVPPGIGTISNLTPLPGIVSTYGFISSGGGLAEGPAGELPPSNAAPRASAPVDGGWRSAMDEMIHTTAAAPKTAISNVSQPRCFMIREKPHVLRIVLCYHAGSEHWPCE